MPDESTTTSVSVVLVATGAYGSFVPAIVDDLIEHLVGLDRIFLLGDQRHDPDVVEWLPWGHTAWPLATLLRYRAITAYRAVLAESEHLLYLDVDMHIRRSLRIGPTTGLIAVTHPGYVDADPATLPFERRPASTSYVAEGEGSTYFAGGVQGGATAAYLEACATIAGWLQDDLRRGIIPRWHDESAWNRYLLTQPPTLVLSTTYCTPEPVANESSVIVALDKNHDQLRQIPRHVRLRRRAVALSGRARGIAGKIARALGFRR